MTPTPKDHALRQLASIVLDEYPEHDGIAPDFRYHTAKQALALLDTPHEPAPLVSHLSRTARGKRVLAKLYELHKEVCGLDDANSRALKDLVDVMTAHTHAATILDLLHPHRSNGQS